MSSPLPEGHPIPSPILPLLGAVHQEQVDLVQSAKNNLSQVFAT